MQGLKKTCTPACSWDKSLSNFASPGQWVDGSMGQWVPDKT